MLEEKFETWYNKIGRKMVILLISLIVIYLIVKLHILSLFAPFIIAWIFATLLNPIVTWANVRLGLHRGIGTILSMISILSGLLWIIYMLIKRLWEQVINLSGMLPQISEEVVTQLNHVETQIANKFPLMSDAVAITSLDNLIEQITNSLSSFLASVLPSIYEGISKVPNGIFFTVIMFLATFFMTKDFYIIKAFVKAQFSDTIVDKIVIMQRGVLEAIGGYVRTQVILMSMTLIICLVGLFVLKIEYALLLSVIIAIIDALPIFGSGAVLIPWTLYHLVAGHYSIAIGLFCIYGIIFMTRQIMEPRILSSQIGIYALVTIMAVYIGYRTIGFLGLIVGPAFVVVVQMLQNVGAIPKFKSINKSVFEGESNEKCTGKRDNKRS